MSRYPTSRTHVNYFWSRFTSSKVHTLIIGAILWMRTAVWRPRASDAVVLWNQRICHWLVALGALVLLAVLFAALMGKISIADQRYAALMPRGDSDLLSCVSNCLLRNQPSLESAKADCPPSLAMRPWCRQCFSADAVKEVCLMLCRNQNPKDCSEAQYLILDGSSIRGFTSDWHQRLTAFSFALSMRRVFLFIGEYDLFYPISRCALPVGWKERAKSFEAVKHEMEMWQFVTYSHEDSSIAGWTELSRPRVFARHVYNHSVLWWKAQLASFAFRPNRQTMSSSVLPMVAQVFKAHSHSNSPMMPANFISLFVSARSLHSLDQYWKLAEDVLVQKNISNIYISADSHGVLDETLALASRSTANVRVFHFRNLATAANALSRASDKVKVILCDLFIASKASAWVGSLASPLARMQDQIRLGNGKFGVPYASLDRGLIGGVVVDDEGYPLQG